MDDVKIRITPETVWVGTLLVTLQNPKGFNYDQAKDRADKAVFDFKEKFPHSR